MEPLNEAQQECKQKGLSVGARGRLRVGRDEEDQQRESLSSPSSSQGVRGHAGCRLLETVGKPRSSHVERRAEQGRVCRARRRVGAGFEPAPEILTDDTVAR